MIFPKTYRWLTPKRLLEADLVRSFRWNEIHADGATWDRCGRKFGQRVVPHPSPLPLGEGKRSAPFLCANDLKCSSAGGFRSEKRGHPYFLSQRERIEVRESRSICMRARTYFPGVGKPFLDLFPTFRELENRFWIYFRPSGSRKTVSGFISDFPGAGKAFLDLFPTFRESEKRFWIYFRLSESRKSVSGFISDLPGAGKAFADFFLGFREPEKRLWIRFWVSESRKTVSGFISSFPRVGKPFLHPFSVFQKAKNWFRTGNRGAISRKTISNVKNQLFPAWGNGFTACNPASRLLEALSEAKHVFASKTQNLIHPVYFRLEFSKTQ